MKYRFFATVALAVMVLALGGSTFADPTNKKANAYQLVSLLPASDAIAVLDVKRFFGEVLPKVLTNNQPVLGKVTGHLDEFQSRTGIDVRQFDHLAAGFTTRQRAAKQYDVDAVMVARGQMPSASLVGAAKLASKGKYREERIGDRVMYIFDATIVTTQTKGTDALRRLPELAMSSLDRVTLAFGDPTLVRATLEGKTRVASDLSVMLEKNLAAVAAFAAKPPAGLKALLPLENDQLGRNIDSIRYLYGYANVVSDTAGLSVTARTQQNAEAASLYETLEGLRVFGKVLLGGANSPDKLVYSRMIENAKFTVRANEVTLDLTVPQSDIDILVGLIK